MPCCCDWFGAEDLFLHHICLHSSYVPSILLSSSDTCLILRITPLLLTSCEVFQSKQPIYRTAGQVSTLSDTWQHGRRIPAPGPALIGRQGVGHRNSREEHICQGKHLWKPWEVKELLQELESQCDRNLRQSFECGRDHSSERSQNQIRLLEFYSKPLGRPGRISCLCCLENDG